MFHVAEMILRCIYYLLCSYHVKLLHTSLHLLLLYSCTHCRLCFDLQPPPPPQSPVTPRSCPCPSLCLSYHKRANVSCSLRCSVLPSGLPLSLEQCRRTLSQCHPLLSSPFLKSCLNVFHVFMRPWTRWNKLEYVVN